jgi:hypothetical protein
MIDITTIQPNKIPPAIKDLQRVNSSLYQENQKLEKTNKLMLIIAVLGISSLTLYAAISLINDKYGKEETDNS